MGQHSILMFTISCSAPLSSLHLRVPTDCPIDLCSAENRAQREAQYVEHDAHAAPVRAKRSHLEDESDPSAERKIKTRNELGLEFDWRILFGYVVFYSFIILFRPFSSIFGLYLL